MFMDIEKRFELIKSVGEGGEIITDEELRHLLETNDKPVAYDGFEPSGLAHIPFGLLRADNLKCMLKAGVKFKLWLADYFAFINNKLGGDLNRIKKAGEYFIEVWKSIVISEIEIYSFCQILRKFVDDFHGYVKKRVPTLHYMSIKT